ncbi:MAG: putative zinc protease [Moraxellaceae bacterium]|jgi:zinc protease|nr:putative zinc protease [Moraxellaceae bacterium]
MPRSLSLRPLLLACALLASPCALAAEAALTSEFTLDNGLKVVVREDHRAPALVVQVWYRIGSAYEPSGLTGMSHALEHMMFKGTQKVPSGEFSRIVALYGGEDNAFTTDDYTAYYQVYTADKLPLALELEADRMTGLVLKPDEVAQEIRVVMEERRLRTDDNPQSLALERFLTLAWLTSPSRTPTIGWMADLENMKLEDLRRWYETWYTPNNATLVVAGDVDPQAVRQYAERFFGTIPARPLPVVRPPRELPEPGERLLKLSLPGKVPALYVGYNLPSLKTGQPGEAEALRMLAGVLDEGISARLETRLVREQQVAAAIASGYDAFTRGDSMLMVRAVPAPGRTLEELQTALFAEIEKLKTETIEEDELKRVYAGYVSADVFERDSVREQASTIGQLESVGYSWRLIDEWPAMLRKVTPAQVQAMAVKYLVPSRRAVLQLQPTTLGSGAPAPATAEGARP